jgi:hypothetical protein
VARAPSASAPKATTDKEPSLQRQRGDQPNTAPPDYKILRYEEDYSYLKDPSRRTDFWDPTKYIPLWGREDWSLSLGGELRERYEFFHNENEGAAPADGHHNSGYLLQRYLLHGDLHVGLDSAFSDNS